MEVGSGHHGEPGIEVVPLETAAMLAARMTDMCCRIAFSKAGTKWRC